MADERVSTPAGELHVEVVGDGPPTVLWHSLFVDSRTWAPLRGLLGDGRRLIVIDGPGHGRSGPPPAGFAFDDCAPAAAGILDALGIAEPVDWVGNAWGGHVGLTLAASAQDRLRSLVTIATPVHALTRRERLKAVPMVWAHRRFGPISPLTDGAAKALLGKKFMATHPQDTDVVISGLRDADRDGINRAMNAVMLERPNIEALLPGIETPTMMIVPTDDPNLPVAQIRAAARMHPHAVAVEIPAEGHVAPLMAHADELARLTVEFWRDPVGRVAR